MAAPAVGSGGLDAGDGGCDGLAPGMTLTRERPLASQSHHSGWRKL